MRAAALAVLIAFAGLSHGRRIVTDTAANQENSESFTQGSQDKVAFAMIMLAYNPAAAFSPAAATGRDHALGALRSGRTLHMSTNHEVPSKLSVNGLSRRSAVSTLPVVAAALATSFGSVRPATANVALETYTDKFFCVSIGIPKGWQPSSKSLTTRVLVGAIDPMDPDFQVTMLLTPIAGDFTSLGAFGTIDDVATTVIPPGSIAAGDAGEGKLLGQETVRGNYVYDYTIQQVNKTVLPNRTTESTVLPNRRLRTLFAVLSGGEVRASSTLVTLTAQCLDSKYAEYEPIMKAVIDSYQRLGEMGLECPARGGS